MNNHYAVKYPNCIQEGSTMFNLIDPKPEMFNIYDIARNLSRIPRWNGSTRQAISIAEHSILVSSMLPPELQLTGLMHDCAEAYIGDLSRPLKTIIGKWCVVDNHSIIEVIENKILNVASIVFNFIHPFPEEIAIIDDRVNETERQLLMHPMGWDFGCDPICNLNIYCYPPSTAEFLFLNRFFNLMKGYKNAQN